MKFWMTIAISLTLITVFSCFRNITKTVPGKWELTGLDCNDDGTNCRQLSNKRLIVQLDDKRIFIEGKPYKYSIYGNKIRIYHGSLYNEGQLIFENDDSVILKGTFLKETVYFQLKRVRIEPLNNNEKLMIGAWQITAKNCNEDGYCEKKHKGPLLYFLKSGRVMDQKTTDTIRFYIKNKKLILINYKKKKKVWLIKFINSNKIVLTTPSNRKKRYLLEKLN